MLTYETTYMDTNQREKPIITTGTRMVVRRPDGLGTAQVGASMAVNTLITNEGNGASQDIVRPHSTIQRAHSTVIPRTKQSKKEADFSSRSLNSIMHKLISNQKIDKLLRNGAEIEEANELKKEKKQKQRVGVNPVLGNAGVMWESNKKFAAVPESEMNQLIQKRKSPIEDIISPKKSKIIEFETQSEKYHEKRKDLDSYTGCLPKHMLHLLPATPKSLATSNLSSPDSVLQQPDLSTILQQYSTLQAATGLANNENAKSLLGGLDQSTALLQLHILQTLQKSQHKFNGSQLTEPIVVNPAWTSPTPITTTVTSAAVHAESPYKITPKIEKSNSKVKCLKTALIPSITKAELDSNPKITNYQGLKMAASVIKPKNNGNITPKKSNNTNKVQANTCILPRVAPYSLERQTQLNILAENEKKFREFIVASLGKPSGSVTATITLTNGEGEVKCFSGQCVTNPATAQFKTVIDLVPSVATQTAGTLSYPVPVIQANVPNSYSNPLTSSSSSTTPPPPTVFTISSSSSTPSITLNSVLNIPRPLLTETNKIKQINLNFPVLDSGLTLNRVERDEISPASSPEIIVDELAPEFTHIPKGYMGTCTAELPATAAAVLKQQLSPPTPTRLRGPKKNFLARQAALDAKLNVLRIRAEAEKSKVDGYSIAITTETPGAEIFELEMSDDEVIQKQ